MKLTVKFKSVVILGGFNPNILSPSFLFDKCGFKSSELPKGRTTPVLSEVIFGNTQFLMELNKFQILTKGIDNFSDFFPLDIAIRYLEVLEFTPLQMLGINFSYELKELKISAIQDSLKKPLELGSLLDVSPNSITLNMKKRNSSGLVVNEVAISHHVDSDITNNLRITLNDESITINNNYEINRLEESSSRMKILADRYGEFVKMDQSVKKTIEGIAV